METIASSSVWVQEAGLSLPALEEFTMGAREQEKNEWEKPNRTQGGRLATDRAVAYLGPAPGPR